MSRLTRVSSLSNFPSFGLLRLGLLWLLSLGIFLPEVQAQVPREDQVAEEFVRRGQHFMLEENYPIALEFLEKAAERPFNRSTTVALYLTGLAHYYQGDLKTADRWWQRLAEDHPQSRYLPEVRYHQALALMQAPSFRQQKKGLDQLIALIPTLENDALRRDAQEQFRNYLILAQDFERVRRMAPRLPEELRPSMIEVLCHYYIEQEEVSTARHLYQSYRQDYDPSWFSPFIEEKLDGPQKLRNVATEARLALFLPLNLAQMPSDSAEIAELPTSQRIALEFYEGFALAMEAYRPVARKKFHIKIFDSRRDTTAVQLQLDKLHDFRPDLLLGDIYNDQSAVLGEWAEQMQVPQVVPLSPSAALAEDKEHVFVAHPTAPRHGAAMAEYAYLVQGMDRVAIWSDQRAGTEMLAQAFEEKFEALGGEIIRLEVDSTFGPVVGKSIQALVGDMKGQDLDGTYLPILDHEEMAGLIFSEIQAQQLRIKVMGSPHFYRRYAHIDRELKEVYGLIFTTGFLFDREHPDYQNFYLEYLRRYQFPPSQYALQGYDLGLYVLTALDGYQPERDGSLSTYLRELPPVHGLHQDIDFLGQQVNQFVNVGAFQDDGTVIKLNGQEEMNLDLISEQP